MTTVAANESDQNQISAEARADHLIVVPYAKDPVTGAAYAHKDLVQVQAAWSEEAHVSPVSVDEKFGDVESWCAYVTEFSKADGAIEPPFLTWSGRGLAAVLDYTDRRQWKASHPFTRTPEFTAWIGIANNSAVEHKHFIEFLEDHAPDIVEPAPLDLLNLLRTLKGASSASFEGTVKADGTADIRYAKTTGVSSGAQSLELPSEITIGIPVLRGHVGADGKVVRYGLQLKLRASVGTDAHLALRLSMPQAERVLEDVYAERVTAAKALLGDGFSILRGAD